MTVCFLHTSRRTGNAGRQESSSRCLDAAITLGKDPLTTEACRRECL